MRWRTDVIWAGQLFSWKAFLLLLPSLMALWFILGFAPDAHPSDHTKFNAALLSSQPPLVLRYIGHTSQFEPRYDYLKFAAETGAHLVCSCTYQSTSFALFSKHDSQMGLEDLAGKIELEQYAVDVVLLPKFSPPPEVASF